MTMELDKMKEIWQSGSNPKDQTFNKEKVMKSIQNRIDLLQLNDKRKTVSLVLGIIWLAIFVLGIILSLVKGNGLDGVGFMWLFGPASLFFFYQYTVFSKTPLHNQPTPVFIKHALKRIRAQKFSQWGLGISFIPIYAKILFEDAQFDKWKSWEISHIIGISTFAIIAIALLWGVSWYQKKYQTGDIRGLERDLKRLKTELGTEGD